MKKALNKRLVMILCAGVFFIALIGLGVAYLAEMQEQKQLSEKLASLEKQTAGIHTEAILYQQLVEKDKIAKFEKQVTAAQAQLTVPLVVSDIFQELLAVAAKTGVGIRDINSTARAGAAITGVGISDINISDINSPVLTSAAITGVHYRTISIDFMVAGSASNIYGFIDTVSKNFRTGVLKTLKVDIKGDTAGESTVGSTANMRLTIHSYEGGYDE